MRMDLLNQEPDSFFCKVFPDGSYVNLIVYVDDKLFFRNNEATPQEFKDKLSKRFDVEFLGQAHWYLSARIHMDASGSSLILPSHFE